MKIVSVFPAEIYPMRLAMVFIGIAVLGFGISLAVIANVIMNSGEAFVKAVSDTIGVEFGTVKVGFDVSCVELSLVLSMLFFDFTIVGMREGTVITALLTGFVVKFFTKRLKEPIEFVLCDK